MEMRCSLAINPGFPFFARESLAVIQMGFAIVTDEVALFPSAVREVGYSRFVAAIRQRVGLRLLLNRFSCIECAGENVALCAVYRVHH